MKNLLQKLQILSILIIFSLNSFSANFKDLPTTITQPDGTTIHCLSSGDEFFNYIHDENGYTIIKGQDGWFYYATKDLQENIIPSSYKVGQINPENTSLKKFVKLNKNQYQQKVDRYFSPLKDNTKTGGYNIGKAPSSGTFNNLVVYIRFADDPAFSNDRQTYIDLFTGTGGATYSVQEYFTSVSYNQMLVNASHFPVCAPSTNLSYQDAHDRGYFQPYNATTNPGGYTDDTDARFREHQLLVDAVNYTKAEIESSLTANDIDLDGDGYVDNMSFIIYGANDAWSDLLWAHRWALYTYTSTIHGKRVWDYTFQPEAQCSARTTCHELFHCMGSPDLYHYTDNGVDPCWYWDLMEYGSGSMTAYMKEQIGGWITIPEITSSGSYQLSPLAGSTNNAYKIALPNSTTEFIVLEFRKKTGPVEVKLASSADEGLLIYRINTDVSINEGNRNGPPDMLWVYRPNGDTNNNGTPGDATFSSTQGRTSFTAATNPALLLSDDATWGGISITNVGAVGTTISFDVTMPASTYNVTFNVSDGTNPIENATVTFDGVPQSTNASGATVFTDISNGTYAYTVTKAGYQDDSGNATVNGSNLTKNITLSQSTYNITFNVSDGTNPIENATVTFDGVPQSTNASGTTVFSGYENGTYAYSVSKTGYVSDNGNVTVNGNHQQKNITIIEDNYDVTFNVSDGTNPIENAAVTFNSLTQYTDATGATIFTNVPIGNGLTYSVTYAGYNDVNSTVNVVNNNVIENVVMESQIATNLALQGIPTANTATLVWEGYGATSYQIQYYINGTTDYFFQTATSSPFTLNALEPNTSYNCRIRTYSGGTYTSYSTILNFTTASGSSILASNLAVQGTPTANTATLIWNGSGATSYQIQYFINGTTNYFFQTATSSPFTLYALEPNTTYNCRIRTYSGGTYTSYSSIVSFTTANGTSILATSLAVQGTPASSTCTLTWNGNGATSYQIIYYQTGTTNYNVRTFYSSPATLTSLLPNTTYNCRIRTYSGGIYTSYSPVTTFTTASLAKYIAELESISKESISEAVIYPNPAIDFYNLDFNSETEGAVNLSIYSIDGRLCESRIIESSLGLNHFELKTPDISTGIYYIMLNKGDFTSKLKLIKQ